MGERLTGANDDSEDAASIPDVTFDLNQARRDIAAGRALPGIDAHRLLREALASAATGEAGETPKPGVGANGGDGSDCDAVFDPERSRGDLEGGRVVHDNDPARGLREHLAAKAVAQNPPSRKLRCPPSVAAAIHSGAAGEFLAIVSVAESHRAPEGVRVRSWIGSTILTAAIDAAALPGVLEDPLVVSVQVSGSPHGDAG